MNANDSSSVTQFPANEIAARFRFGRVSSGIIVAVFLLGIVANVARIVKQYQTPAAEFDTANAGLGDYHNGVYFPAHAFRQRINPYGNEYTKQYPVPRPIPFYSPVTLIMHVPFSVLDLRTSEVVYSSWLFGLTMLLAWITVRFSGIRPRWQWVLLVATFILFSRAGHSTIYTGYFTFELIIGTLVALQYAKTRPFLSAVGLLVASGKPTYVIPLGLVMLARGNSRAVFLGGVLSAVVAGAGFAWLASNSSVSALVDAVSQGQGEHIADVKEFPVNSWIRVDVPAIIAKWIDWNPGELPQLAMMCVLIAPVLVVIWSTRKRLSDEEGAATIIGMICCLAVVVTFYHHFYDMLVIVVPCFAALTLGVNWRNTNAIPRGIHLRLVVVICAAIPLVNYSTSLAFLNRITEPADLIHRVLTSINALCAVVALTASCLIAIKSAAFQAKTVKPEELPSSNLT